MPETLGHLVTVVLRNGENVPIGFNVKRIEEKSGGVKVIRQANTNIPTLVSPEDRVEVRKI